MAAANFDQYDLGDNVREDLSDILTMIDPTKTPYISTICSSGSAAQSYYEWIKDGLGEVDGDNARVDGADAGADVSNKGDRVGNYAQISDKPIRISGRAEMANKAGRKSEMKRQLMKAGLKLKRDMETIATGNQASVAGDSANASYTGSLCAWLETNTDRDATSGADGGFDSGIVAAATDSSGTRALSEAVLLGIVKDCYVAGGEPSIIMVGPTMKQRFSNYMFGSDSRIATPYNEGTSTPMTALGAIDLYVSDFGKLKVVPNRFQRERDVFVLDKSMHQIAYFRKHRTNKLAKTGDADNRQLLVDWGVKIWDEAANGVVADIDHTTAMVA